MFTTIQLIESRFPGALLVKPTAAGALLGQSNQSSYNQVHQGRFPVPLVCDHLGRKMVRVTDLSKFLDGLVVIPACTAKERKPITGRPKKSEALEAKRLGLTVYELRAQQPLALDSNKGGAV